MSQIERHTMTRTSGNGDVSLFTCRATGCTRRLLFNHVLGEIVVLDEGSGALHQGSSGPVDFGGSLAA
jgi:hypothetical protein